QKYERARCCRKCRNVIYHIPNLQYSKKQVTEKHDIFSVETSSITPLHSLVCFVCNSETAIHTPHFALSRL
ncbi:hypothetical protein, partial [Prevotella falsenii]|uniref:hypothetical protein n=1 Tax=Prevotella falsenii TaxID=515414 RepID=UPI001E2D7F8B